MAVELFTTATEFVANELTLLRGVVGDILTVGVYHNINPNTKPAVVDFTLVTLVPGSGALAEGTKIDVLSKIGTKAGFHVTLPVGDYQRWVLVQTASEDIIRKVDVISVK